MKRIKYIVFDNIPDYPVSPQDVMVILPEFVNHATVAKKIGGEVLSAGFVDLENNTCYGESTSLKIKSREVDSKLFNLYFKEKF